VGFENGNMFTNGFSLAVFGLFSAFDYPRNRVSNNRTCFPCSFVPESPRWLIQKGRFKEAGLVIKKMAAFNNKPEPDLSVLKQLQNKEEGEELTSYNYADLFRTKSYAIKSSVVLFIW
jgi:hypothetical protein